MSRTRSNRRPSSSNQTKPGRQGPFALSGLSDSSREKGRRTHQAHQAHQGDHWTTGEHDRRCRETNDESMMARIQKDGRNYQVCSTVSRKTTRLAVTNCSVLIQNGPFFLEDCRLSSSPPNPHASEGRTMPPLLGRAQFSIREHVQYGERRRGCTL